MSSWQLLVVSALGGVLYALGFCGFDQDYLAWVCMLPMLYVLHQSNITLKKAFQYGLCCGFVAYASVCWWVVQLLQNFALFPWVAAVAVHGLLSLAHGTRFAIWAVLCAWLQRQHAVAWRFAAPIAMVLVEWLLPALFPSYLANSQYQRYLFVQNLDIVGPLGLTFIIMWVNGLLYETCTKTVRLRDWLLCASVIIAMLLYGYIRAERIEAAAQAATQHIKIGIVQANMGIYEKRGDPEEGLRRHQEQSLALQEAGAEMIVWPESGYYYVLHPTMTDLKSHVLGPVHTPILFGGLRSEAHHMFNSAFLTDAQGQLVGSYDKNILLAFGEFVPLVRFFPFIYKWLPQTGQFDAGTSTTPLVLGGIKYGIMICYEDILPDFVRRVMRHQPDILVNITNDAWYGRSHEPMIHLALASFRAIEQRRYLVRATNTGISAIVAPTGRIIATTSMYERANLIADVSTMHEVTVYQRFGNIVGYICVIYMLCIILRSYMIHKNPLRF